MQSITVIIILHDVAEWIIRRFKKISSFSLLSKFEKKNHNLKGL